MILTRMAAKPPSIEHIEKSSRILHTWNPSRIKSARLQADSGHLGLVADLCDDIMADDSIMATLGIRASSILGAPLEFQHNGDKRRSSTVIAALELDWWQMNPEFELKTIWAWAVLLGIAPAELVILEQHNRVIPRVKFWHPRWLKFNWETRGYTLQTATGDVPFVTGNGQWLAFTPYGSRAPWKLGAWRGVALWWLLKQYALTDWARYSEKHGGGILAGTLPPSAQGDPKARKELAADLADLGSDTSVALPPGYDLKLVEATANTWQTFKAQIEMADAGIAVAILGQNLTTRVSEGSRAAAQVHDAVRNDLRRSDAEIISTITREQQLAYWAEWNFGNADLAPWAKWNTTPPADLKLEAETLNTAADALGKLKTLGVNITPQLEKFGLEVQSVNQSANDVAASRVFKMLQQPRSTAFKGIKAAPAFLEGQVYADELGDTALGLDLLGEQRQSVLAAIENATSPDDLRNRLLDAYDQMDSSQATEMISRMLVLAALAGQYSATQEAPELEPEA